MTSNDPENSVPGSDEVTEAYRKANFDEGPPPSVDQAILAAARQEQRKPFPAYLPPLALAATVVLSVSLVLRSGMLNETADVFSEPAMAPAADTPGATVLERDVNMPSEEIRAIEEEAAFSDAAAGADELQPSVGGSDAIEEAPAAADLRALAPQPEPNAERQLAPPSLEIEPAAASLSSSTVAGAACTEADRQQAGSWIECISALRANGDENAARTELEAFTEAYPSITVPANLRESPSP